MEQFTEKLTKLKSTKVEQKLYTDEINGIHNTLLKLTNDIEQNKNRGITTENYLEKYLPFRIQNIISENFHNTFETKIRLAFLEFEKQKYKTLNDIILSDDGKPNLNKTEHYIPPLEKIEKALILSAGIK